MRYIEREGLRSPMDYVFEHCIRTMDQAYMEYQRKRQEQERERARKNAESGARRKHSRV